MSRSVPFQVGGLAATLIVAFLGGCGGGATGASTSSVARPVALSQEEIQDLHYMREEEKLARDVYLELADHWRAHGAAAPLINALENISRSEQMHMNSLKSLLAAYQLPDPVDPAETRGRFINPALAQLYRELLEQGRTSQAAALKVGALIEEVDLSDLEKALATSRQAGIDQVYGSLACGSRNHLRAFVGQWAVAGGAYAAQVLPQPAVDGILAGARESCN